MSKREHVTAIDAGEALAGPTLTADEATTRFLAWRRAGIIPDVGKARTGERGKPPFLFDEAAPAIAAVLFWIHDYAGIRDAENLRQFWSFFAVPDEAGGHPAIDHVLAEVMDGGSPVLVLTRWIDVSNGDTGKITAALRFDEDRDRPIEMPTRNHEAVSYIVLETGPLLQRFARFTPIPVEAVH